MLLRYRMPTKDSVKNREYVAKSRAKQIAAMGEEAYKKQQAEAQKLRRLKLKVKANEKVIEDVKTKVVAKQVASNMTNDLFASVLSSVPSTRRGRPKLDTPISTEGLSKKDKYRVYMRLYMRTYKKSK